MAQLVWAPGMRLMHFLRRGSLGAMGYTWQQAPWACGMSYLEFILL